jgi:hypothetical protein
MGLVWMINQRLLIILEFASIVYLPCFQRCLAHESCAHADYIQISITSRFRSTYLLCIHCGRVSFIVVFCVLCFD